MSFNDQIMDYYVREANKLGNFESTIQKSYCKRPYFPVTL